MEAAILGAPARLSKLLIEAMPARGANTAACHQAYSMRIPNKLTTNQLPTLPLMADTFA
jgi:hypothetical protein